MVEIADGDVTVDDGDVMDAMTCVMVGSTVV